MYLTPIVLNFALTVSTPLVIHARQKIPFSGATLMLLIFNDKLLQTDAAWSNLRRQVGRYFGRRQPSSQDEEENSSATRLVEPPEGVRRISQAIIKDVIEIISIHFSFYGTLYQRRHQFQMFTKFRTTQGEHHVAQVLHWRFAGPGKPKDTLFDAIFSVGEKKTFFSCTLGDVQKLIRQSRLDESPHLSNIWHPQAGEMTMSAFEVSEAAVGDPAAVRDLSVRLLISSVAQPGLKKFKSHTEIQQRLRLLLVHDVVLVPDEGFVLRKPVVPGKVAFNLFRLYTRTECTLFQLLSLMRTQHNTRKHHVYYAQRSLSIQILNILLNLRKLGLIIPPVNAHNFVVSSTGTVYLADFAPCLKEGSVYVRAEHGAIVEKSKFKANDRTPHVPVVNTSGRDAALILHTIWCLQSGDNTSAENNTSTNGNVPGKASVSSTAELGGSTRSELFEFENWHDCGDVPDEVKSIVKELWTAGGSGLTDIDLLPAFDALKSAVVFHFVPAIESDGIRL